MDNWTEQQWQLFLSIYANIPRQGPGDNVSTHKAYYAFKQLPNFPRILDVGCGTGVQTVELSKISRGEVHAIDNHAPFINILKSKVQQQALRNIEVSVMDMFEMNVREKYFDIIWSEGAIYFYGFQNALRDWKNLFRTKARFAFTEANLFNDEVPPQVMEMWETENPEICTIKETLQKIEELEYKVILHFKLSRTAWMENYYVPLQKAIDPYKGNLNLDAEKKVVIDYIQKEINDYKKLGQYYGYTFYVCESL